MDAIKKRALLVELPLLVLLLWAGWSLRLRSLYFVMQIGEVLILTAVLKCTPLMELSVGDLAAVAVFMLFNQVLLQFLSFLRLGFSHAAAFAFLLLPELFALLRGLHRRKRGYGVAVGYGTLSCFGILCIYQPWEGLALDYYLGREGEFGYAVKGLYLLAATAVMAAPLLFALRRLGAFVGKRLVRLQEYSMAYKEIDRSVLLVMLLTFGTLSMREWVGALERFLPQDNEIYWFPFMSAVNTYDIPLLWTGFSVMLVLIQAVYIRLLVKSISAKEEMRLQERDFALLAEYNRQLEANMEDMREIRHDMKNMFLTMGGFVDRSQDEEMKAFYTENIVPFAKRELQKNDLYGKLACIHSEGLKSFLYFKIMQAIEQDVPVDLAVQLAGGGDVSCMAQTDLIRILGILMDNALEEAKRCGGSVAITIKEGEGEYLFSVSNTVRSRVREKGVAAGTTDKGPGRGKGLLIVDKLVGKYRNVLLNSFFRGDEFVQCLRIEK